MSDIVLWNFTIEDTSPLFQYSPYSDTNAVNGTSNQELGNGWVSWYSESNYLQSLGVVGAGDSYHLTSKTGASVSLSFYGTGIALYGQWNASYEVSFDGNISSNPSLEDGILFSNSNQPAGNHTITLTAASVNANEILGFKKAIIISDINTLSEIPTTLTIDNQNTSSISYTGDWIPNKTFRGVPSVSSPAPFHTTSAYGASFSVDFVGSAIEVYGSLVFGHGQYSVTLDSSQQEFNGTSEWLVGNGLLFFQDALSDNFTHTLNVTNLGSGFSLSSVQITQFNSTSSALPSSVTSTSPLDLSSSHGKSNTPVIVGSVMAVLAVLVGIGLFIWKRRRTGLERYSTTIDPCTFTHPADSQELEGMTSPFKRQTGTLRREWEIESSSNFQKMKHSAATSSSFHPNAYYMANNLVPGEDIMEINAPRMNLPRPPVGNGFEHVGDSAGPPPYAA